MEQKLHKSNFSVCFVCESELESCQDVDILLVKGKLFTPDLIPSAAGSSSSSAFFSRVGLHYSTHRSQAPCDGVSSVHVAYFSSGHILPRTPPAHEKKVSDSCSNIFQHFQYFPACKHLMTLLSTTSKDDCSRLKHLLLHHNNYMQWNSNTWRDAKFKCFHKFPTAKTK